MFHFSENATAAAPSLFLLAMLLFLSLPGCINRMDKQTNYAYQTGKVICLDGDNC